MPATSTQLFNEYCDSNCYNPEYWINLRIAGAFDHLKDVIVSEEEKAYFLVQVQTVYPII